MVVHSSSFSGLFHKECYISKTWISELVFKGDYKIFPICVILVFEAKRLLHKGCEAYLAYIIDISTLEVTLGNVPIVQKFPDVFFKNLLGLSLDRELKFGIDLLLGSAFVSVPLYRMAPIELKELKIQLQDLVDKDFI